MSVSIIVTVYNVEKYIEKCLKSLVNQTLKDIEIIVVNDGSPDNSQKIIDKYKKKYPSLIKSYVKKNSGVSSTRNYGIEHAKGKYIGFVDGDDYVDKTMFEKMYNKALENNYDIVLCDANKYYNENLQIYNRSNFHYSNDDVKNYIISQPAPWARLYKRTIFNEFRFKEGIIYEDLELNPSLVTKFKKIAFIEEPLYYYVQHDNSIMSQKNFNSKLLDIFPVLDSIENTFKDNDCYEEYYFEIEYLYITHLLRTGGLRFSQYKEGKKYIKQISNIFHTKYKDWRKNQYYKKSNYKLKIICNLTYYRFYIFLKLLNKVNR